MKKTFPTRGTYAALLGATGSRDVFGNEDELSASQKKATTSGPCARNVVDPEERCRVMTVDGPK